MDWLVSLSALAVIFAPTYTGGWESPCDQHTMDHLQLSVLSDQYSGSPGDWCLVASWAGHAFMLTGDLDIFGSILLVQDYFSLISAFTVLVNKYHLLFTNYVLHKHVYNF